MNLPVELQAFILSKLDGASLGRAKQVCTLWYDCIEKLEVLGNIWRLCCFREISPETFYELSDCDILELPPLSHHWSFWKNLYSVYHRTSYIKSCCSWKFQTLDLGDISTQKATNLIIHKSNLLMGFQNGYVCLCKNPTSQSPEFFPFHQHGRQVTGLAVLRPNQQELSPLLVSVSGGHDIQISSLDGSVTHQLNYHSKPISCLSCWGERFVTGSSDTMLHGQPIWKLKDQNTVFMEGVLRGHVSEKTTCTSIWDDKVASGDDKGNVFVWEITAPISPHHVGCFNSKIKWISLRGSRLIWLTGNGVLFISLDCRTYQSRDVYKAIHGKPESVAINGPIFAIGAKSGFLHLYYVSTCKDWSNINLSHPDSTIKVDAEHINALDISDDGQGPMIYLATENGVTLIQWKKIPPKRELSDNMDNLTIKD